MKDRYIKFYNKLSTKEFCISKNGKTYILNGITYGNWFTYSCYSLKQCFNIIRSYK